MVSGGIRPSYFTIRTLVAYAIAYTLATLAIVLGFAFPSVPWLVFGVWFAASLTVLLIDRAVGGMMPRPGWRARGNILTVFQGSPAALTVIGVMTVTALLIALFAR